MARSTQLGPEHPRHDTSVSSRSIAGPQRADRSASSAARAAITRSPCPSRMRSRQPPHARPRPRPRALSPGRGGPGRPRRSGGLGAAAVAGRCTLTVVPDAGLRVELDLAAGLADDAVDRREPQAGALALRLGGEEGLEDAGLRSRRPCPRPCRSPSAGRSGRPQARPRASASSSTFAVSITRLPPPGIASRALTARLTSTCSSWPGSASTGHSPARAGSRARRARRAAGAAAGPARRRPR